MSIVIAIFLYLYTLNMTIVLDVSDFTANFFGEWLRKQRNKRAMSAAELGRLSGVSKSYISALERSQVQLLTGRPSQPALHIVEAIAKALEVDIDEARMIAGYGPVSEQETPPEGLFKGYERLSPEMKKVARRQIESIIESLAEVDDFDYDYIDDPADKK